VQWMLFRLPGVICKRCAVTNAKIWDEVLAKISEYKLNEIKLPRHMRPPSRFEQQLLSHIVLTVLKSSTEYIISALLMPLSVTLLHDRFAQTDVKLYAGMETVVTGACRKQDTTSQLDDLCCKYDDFDKSRLTLQLRMLPDLCPSATTVPEAVAQFRTKSHEVRLEVLVSPAQQPGTVYHHRYMNSQTQSLSKNISKPICSLVPLVHSFYIHIVSCWSFL